MRGNGAEQDVALDLSLALPPSILSSCLDGAGKGGLGWLEAQVGPKHKGWEPALWAPLVIQHSLSAYCVQGV